MGTHSSGVTMNLGTPRLAHDLLPPPQHLVMPQEARTREALTAASGGEDLWAAPRPQS